ncbi:MAG: methyltransferase [Armatimonadota bacterium]|nr:methyltransferase [Armatimonadota bacterium]
MEGTLASRDRANRLFDAYGSLLTPQQRRLLERYYQDDLSLGEIAQQTHVSRQAVHDGLRRAMMALERYEAALGLVRTGAQGASAHGAPDLQGTSRPRSEHYFSRRPSARLRPREATTSLRGTQWVFQTAGGVFAARAVDPGSRLLIETMRIGRTDHVLDLGCGYGPIGLVAARLASRGRAWLIETNPRAAGLALANARRNRVANARVVVADGATVVRPGTMDVVATNPPIRAGRAVVRGFIEGAWQALRPGGRFYLVARTAQGAKTLARLIASQFGDVRQVAIRRGYRVYEATKETAHV